MFPQNGRVATERLGAMLNVMLQDVLRSPLQNDIVLQNIHQGKRLNELGFYLPASRSSNEQLSQVMKSHDYPDPSLHFGEPDAYLKGFIDLVFEHAGRYYILDWKSNYLGNAPADYDTARLLEAMRDNGYYLQYLLYTIALHRFLSVRLPDYSYDEHFGGVLYLFVRGVRPDWKKADGTTCGVFFDRPSKNIVDEMGRLFSSSVERAA